MSICENRHSISAQQDEFFKINARVVKVVVTVLLDIEHTIQELKV